MISLKWLTVLSIVGVGGIGLVFSDDTPESKSPQPQPASNNAVVLGNDDIVGQWRSVIENPAHPNTVARRYMRHTFFLDGEVVVENEENSSISSSWQYDNGIFIVKRVSGTSEFIEHYRLNDRDNLEKVLFQSIINGEPVADYNPQDQFIRQGSKQASSMGIRDIFASANSAMEFIDPNTLSVGSAYMLSRKTPVMPNYVLSDLADVSYAQPGEAIMIVEKNILENTIWYQVQTENAEGWINSIALFGQELKVVE